MRGLHRPQGPRRTLTNLTNPKLCRHRASAGVFDSVGDFGEGELSKCYRCTPKRNKTFLGALYIAKVTPMSALTSTSVLYIHLRHGRLPHLPQPAHNSRIMLRIKGYLGPVRHQATTRQGCQLRRRSFVDRFPAEFRGFRWPYTEKGIVHVKPLTSFRVAASLFPLGEAAP